MSELFHKPMKSRNSDPRGADLPSNSGNAPASVAGVEFDVSLDGDFLDV